MSTYSEARSGTRGTYAAGGVVWRRSPQSAAGRHAADQLEVALIHRPRYDDWSIPKGKAESGESPLDTAVREIGEEIGSKVAVNGHLAQVRYRIAAGPKIVDYWSMRHTAGTFSRSSEADKIAWLPLEQARAKVSYKLDRHVLDTFATIASIDSVVVLIRHAKAGKRSQWGGDDANRPLESAGWAQARRLAAFGRHFAPSKIISADRVRCTQTVELLADAVDSDIELSEIFTDDGYFDNPQRAVDALWALGARPGATVLCSQGGAIPGMLKDLDLKNAPASFATRKGAAWVLCFSANEIISLDYYPRASS